MKKKEKVNWYSVSTILEYECIWNLILGQKGNGKSTSVTKWCLQQALEHKHNFMYVRRWETECSADKVEHYFKFVEEKGILKDLTKGKWDRISVYRHTIYTAKLNSLNKIERGSVVGYVMPLSMHEHYSSGQYPDVYNFIFEEFVSKRNMYIDNEPSQLMYAVSTILRHKEKEARIFLIGNTISRLCPYFRHWQLTRISKQEQNTVDIYNIHNEDGSTTRLAVQYCEELNIKSSVFFGQSRKAIVSGIWECDYKPCLPFKYKGSDVLYSLFYRVENILFKISVLYNPNTFGESSDYNRYVLFVNEEEKERVTDTTRLVDSTLTDLCTLHTHKLTPITNGDDVVLDLLKQGLVFYSDNLTGTEFEDSIGDLI